MVDKESPMQSFAEIRLQAVSVHMASHVDMESVFADARTTADEQRSLAQTMQAAGDAKHWYLQLCHLTTEELLARATAGELANPSWALRLVSLLHTRFLHNLRRWMSPCLGAAEPHWESAFSAFHLTGEAMSVFSALTAMHLALRAQLEHDLPQVVAQTLRDGLADDYARYRLDLHATARALCTAMERLLAQAAAPHLPRWLARTGARFLGEVLEQLLRRYVYDVTGQHVSAFERGVRLVGPRGVTSRKAQAAYEIAPDSAKDAA